MSLADTLRKSFARSFKLYDDLVRSTSEETLQGDLQPYRSNTLGEQLWCVTGARESYARAIGMNKWAGFSCSLESTTSRADVVAALRQSADAVNVQLAKIESFTATQNQLVIDLLEHEAAHHGQIIRYIYALKITVPGSWKEKYALGES